ncbi:MAG: hypothetical protein CFE39_03625 [Comamonadaceae bacterium PBBC2]|nr:MAG: hypothetical protein CFE39_03625 [Comamonadaceae bacterium PBBC2]
MWESVVVLLAAALALWQGAQPAKPAPPVPDAPPVSLTVAQVMALQPAAIKAPLTSLEGEHAVYTAAWASLQTYLTTPFDPSTDEGLPDALEAVPLFGWDAGLVRARLLHALPGLATKPVEYQRAVLTGAHTLFWAEAATPLMGLLPQITTPKEFAIAAYTVLRASDTGPVRAGLRAQMQANFAQWEQEPRLQALERRLRAEPPDDLAQRPPLLDLLQAPIKPGYPVVFSLQRHNRTYPGLAVVRGADGRFVRKPDGSVFALAQLALAKSHLPGTITNGNTPQGVFVVKGTVAATNQWIGPTPALQSKLPTEATVPEFAHDESTVAAWDESRYWSYLPPSWQGYAPLREAWLAGLAGRDEMWLHGDTVNPHYYRNASYFPYAPSAGCMVAIEYWSQADGTLLQSDQLALVKAFASSGTLQGYLVVVELDDRQQPVALADVLQELLAAEAR